MNSPESSPAGTASTAGTSSSFTTQITPKSSRFSSSAPEASSILDDFAASMVSNLERVDETIRGIVAQRPVLIALGAVGVGFLASILNRRIAHSANVVESSDEATLHTAERASAIHPVGGLSLSAAHNPTHLGQEEIVQ